MIKYSEEEGFIKYNNDIFKSYTYLKGGIVPKKIIKQVKPSINLVKPKKRFFVVLGVNSDSKITDFIEYLISEEALVPKLYFPDTLFISSCSSSV